MIPNRFKIIFEVTRKEMYEHFKTKRLMVISIIFAIVFFIIMGVGHYLVGGDVPVYKRGANEALGILLAFASLFPPILAIALSYDLIVGERTRRSLHLILSKPVDRSSVYIGKFLGAFLSISLVYLVVCTIGYLVVIITSGKMPSSMDVGNAYAAIGIILFSAACWILFVMLFSTSFKTITSTIIFSVMFWLFILNLLSQAGLIYYLVTLETGDKSITIDIINPPIQTGADTSSLIFYAHNFETPVFGVEYEVRAEDNTVVPYADTGGLFSMFTIYILPPGNYTWSAQYEDEDKRQDIIDDGFFQIRTDFSPVINVINLDNDSFYNDMMVLAGTGLDFDNNNSRYDIKVTSTDDNEVIDQTLDYSGPYYLKDLDKGDYQIEIAKGSEEYFNMTFHSYGKVETSSNPFALTSGDEEIEFPDYVKYTFILNPDNAGSVYLVVLNAEADLTGIITLEEGLLALTIEFTLLLLLGLLIFSRIELL